MTVQSVKVGVEEIATVKTPADSVAAQFVPLAREISSIAPVAAVVRPSIQAVDMVRPLEVIAPLVAALMSERTWAAVRVLIAWPEVDGSPVNTAKKPATEPKAAAFSVVGPPLTVKPLAPVRVAEAALSAPARVTLPVDGLNENLVELTFNGKLPVFAVTHVGYIVALVVVSSVTVRVETLSVYAMVLRVGPVVWVMNRFVPSHSMAPASAVDKFVPAVNFNGALFAVAAPATRWKRAVGAATKAPRRPVLIVVLVPSMTTPNNAFPIVS